MLVQLASPDGEHLLLHYPRYERGQLVQQCGTERLDEILSRPAAAAHAARWLANSGAMEQFKVAKEIEEEDTQGYAQLKECPGWD